MLDDYERRIRILEAPSGEALGNTVAKLAESIAQTVKPVTFYHSEYPAAITVTPSDAAVVSIPVPDGYTRAVVNATAAATLRSDQAAGGWSLLTCAAIIAPVPYGTFYNQLSHIPGQLYGNVTAISAAAIEDLAPGSSISVRARVSFPAAYTLPRAVVAGSILFLR
ncbi:hypothetical protein [Microbacterium paulum]